MLPLPAILLVDDDATTNFLNQLLLRRLHIEAETLLAANGQEALALLQARCQQHCEAACPTLVLLDLNMPVMDGLEFLETFTRLPLPVVQRQGIVIVLLTTTLLERDLARLRLLPVADVLHKPLTKESFLKIMRDYFGSTLLAASGPQ